MEIGNLNNKIAVCFSGQVRTAIYTLPYIKAFLNMRGIDYFVHTWDTDTILPHCVNKGFLSYDYSVPVNVDNKHIKFIEKILNPKEMIVDNIAEYEKRYHKDVIIRKGKPPTMVVGLFNSMHEANKLKKNYENKCGSKYKYVLKLRLDTVYGADSLRKQIHYMNIGKKIE